MTIEPEYKIYIGKSLSDPEVPEIIITNRTKHPVVPGVEIIDYKIPALDKESLTTGMLKTISSKQPKTIYDPAIWTDDELKRAINEVIEYNYKNYGEIKKYGRLFEGMTKEGYPMQGVINNNNL